ncbi:MAG: YihY/virulence factor BrkB family protein [Halanaerobiales bacterium]|nr:YihY/virulence factor BrkB family protein [Halanaerobiales bacterium]
MNIIDKTKNKGIYILKRLVKRYTKHDIQAYGALMAFFFTLSLFPFLIVLFAILGKLSLDTNLVLSTIEIIFPQKVHYLVIEFINQNIILKDFSILSISIIGVLWSSSRGIRALMKSLNMAYEVKENRNYLHLKFIDILYTVLIIVGIAFLLTLPNIGKGFFSFISNYLYIDPKIYEIFNLIKLTALPFAIILTIVTLYMYLPNQNQSITNVLPGTIFTLFSWTALSYLFSIFINYIANFSLIYGSLSAIIILMLWLYLFSLILIIGGEINSISKEINTN